MPFLRDVFALASLLLPSAIAAQQPAPPPPTLHVTTREVLLDVSVTDRAGHPVAGLTARDFTVKEEGDLQTIRSLDEHRPPDQPASFQPAPPLPANTFTNYTPAVGTGTLTVILLDAQDTSFEVQARARAQLIAYLKHAQPGAPIAIFQLGIALRLVQGFTADPALLLAAAESKRDTPSVDAPDRGRGYVQYEMRHDTLTSAMQSIGLYLAAYPGRKNLIWFTGRAPIYNENFGTSFRDEFDVLPIADDANDLTTVLATSRVALYPVDARGLQPDPTFSASHREIEPRGAGSLAFSREQAASHARLDTAAEATGGKAFYNTNDFVHVLDQVIQNGASYYSLTYATTNTKWNGQYRNIRIEVDRPDLTLQYRKGYYAFNPEQQEQRQIAALERRAIHPRKSAAGEQLSAPSSPFDPATQLHRSPHIGFVDAMQLGAVAPTEIVFAASLAPGISLIDPGRNTPLPAENFLHPPWSHKPYRNDELLFDADFHRIRLTQTADGLRHGTVEFVAVVFDEYGEPVNTLKKTASLNLSDAQYRLYLEHGLPLRTAIAIPAKGNYFLRLGVHDLASDRAGALEIPVDQIKLGVAGQGFQKPQN